MAALDKQRELGTGSFGEVSLSWWEGGHMDVAVKANGVSCANKAAIDNERTLLELLLQHPHKNILVVYGIVTDAPDGSVRLVMAYCSGGSLDTYLTAIREAGEVRSGFEPTNYNHNNILNSHTLFHVANVSLSCYRHTSIAPLCVCQ